MTIIIPVWVLVLLILLSLPIMFCTINGMLDLYAMNRLRKNNGIDKTAIYGNWINLKWMFASRSEKLLKAFPFLGQDLSELLGLKEDDGKAS